MRKPIALLAAALMVVALAAPVQARQDFSIDSYSTSYDHSTSTITWTIKFTAKPDFATADEFNRQHDSFQIIVPDEEVVRGEEIHCVGDIPIRRVSPSVDEPCSGGWGRVVTEVPYTLHGKTLTFQTPGLSFHQSQFDYVIEAAVYGSQTFHGTGTVFTP